MGESLNLNDLDGGAGSWKPEEIGDKISGIIAGVKRVQQTDFTTGVPLEWSNGDKRMQTVIQLETDLSASDDDDGMRSVWLKGGKSYEAKEGKGKSGEVALAEAAKAAGATSIDEGAKLQVIFTGIAKPTTRGFQSAKLYQMKYTAPKASVAVDDFDD